MLCLDHDRDKAMAGIFAACRPEAGNLFSKASARVRFVLTLLPALIVALISPSKKVPLASRHLGSFQVFDVK